MFPSKHWVCTPEREGKCAHRIILFHHTKKHPQDLTMVRVRGQRRAHCCCLLGQRHLYCSVSSSPPGKSCDELTEYALTCLIPSWHCIPCTRVYPGGAFLSTCYILFLKKSFPRSARTTSTLFFVFKKRRRATQGLTTVPVQLYPTAEDGPFSLPGTLGFGWKINSTEWSRPTRPLTG